MALHAQNSVICMHDSISKKSGIAGFVFRPFKYANKLILEFVGMSHNVGTDSQ